MAKFRDKRNARAKATLCKPKRDEGWEKRHDRRFKIAGSFRSWNAAQQFCIDHGLIFYVANEGHHWIFHLPGNELHLAQWWPRTAKLVIWHRYKEAIHAHDILQVTEEIEFALKRHKKTAPA